MKALESYRSMTVMLLLGWVAGIASVAAVGLGLAVWILFGGLYNTSATNPHLKIVAWAVHNTMISSVRKRAELSAGASHLSGDVLSGAKEYELHCIACHGGPGVARAPWVSAMLPTPPFLVSASRHWSRRELYEIVHDGVKMTGMPAWGEIESDHKIVDIVAFLDAMPAITPDKFAKIRSFTRAQPQGNRDEPK